MLKSQLVSLLVTIEQIEHGQYGIKFSYGIARNKEKIKPEVENLKKLYNDKKIALLEEYADKDADGKPIIVKTENEMVEYQINEPNRTPLHEAINKITLEYFDILAEDVDLDLYRIKIDYFPDNLTPAQMECLLPIVDAD